MRKKPSENDRSSLLDHLEEIQRKIIICLVAIGVGAGICYFYTKKMLMILTKPLGTNLVFLSPQEAFITTLEIAIFGGVILALPVISHQCWRFISSGLKKREKRYIIIYLPTSVVLFFIGCIFSYFIILPIGLKFLLGIGGGYLQPMISIERYISFVIILLLAFGMVFELPLITVSLTRIGLLTPDFLIQKRRAAIVGIFVIAALLTPPDIFTQLLMVGPVVLLYEISIWLSKFVYRKQKEKVS